MPQEQKPPLRIPFFMPAESRDNTVASGGTPQKDQKLVNCFPEKIGDKWWIVKRPGLGLYGSIGANALIDLSILELATTVTFTPVTNSFTVGTSATIAIPTNAQLLTILCWGAGGSGASAPGGDVQPGGGGGGAGVKKTVAIASADWTKLLTYSVGVGGAGVGGTTNGHDGTVSQVTSSGCSFPDLALIANGGKGGKRPAGGAGGTASGGDTNVSGHAGITAYPSTGGNSATLNGITGLGQLNPTVPGGGSNGRTSGNTFAGATGRIDFIWS